MPPRAKVILDPALATPAPGGAERAPAQAAQMAQLVQGTEVEGPILDRGTVSASTQQQPIERDAEAKAATTTVAATPTPSQIGSPPLQPPAAEVRPSDPEPGEPRLLIDWPKRRREPEHLKHVRTQPCLICSRTPSDAHHLRFAQSRGIGLKVSDEFTVPLCRVHHDQLHQSGKEIDWWSAMDRDVDPLAIARALWEESQAKIAAEESRKDDSLRATRRRNEFRWHRSDKSQPTGAMPRGALAPGPRRASCGPGRTPIVMG